MKNWTEEEHFKLKELCDQLPRSKTGQLSQSAWRIIRKEFSDRTSSSLYLRVSGIYSGKKPTFGAVTGSDYWTKEELEKMAFIVKDLPKRSNGALRRGGLAVLQQTFLDRSLEAIQTKLSRLTNFLQPSRVFNSEPWTDEEVVKLKETYAQDKFKLNLNQVFPNRKAGDVVAKAMELGLSRKRLKIVPFRLSPEDAALAAGMVNGDGHVSMVKRPGHENLWYINVGFTNAEKVMVDWFVERIPRGNVNVDDQRHIKGPIQHKLITYKWALYDKPTICIFLEQISPYLLGKKKEKAKEILSYLIPIIAKDVADSYPLIEVKSNAA